VYSDFNRTNRSFVKRFSHARRFRVAERLLIAQRPRTILDFGTGDGHFLGVILSACTPELVVGYEPDAKMFEELRAQTFAARDGTKVRLTRSIVDEAPASFDTVVCLEVLEHLAPGVRREALQRFRDLLTDGGKAVISVPIEVGTASLFKNCMRLLIGQPHDNTSPRTMLRSLLGLAVARPSTSYIASHIGFDYRELETEFKNVGLDVTHRCYSPLPLFGPFLNSQVFYVVVKTSRETGPGRHHGVAGSPSRSA